MKVKELANKYQKEKENLCGMLLVLMHQYSNKRWDAFERRCIKWIEFGNNVVST